MLVPVGVSDQVAVVHLEIPGHGSMPEHDHGASEIVLIPLAGSIELRHDGTTRTLSTGSAGHVARGERVSLRNPDGEPVSLMVVASPPDFVKRLATWPVTV
jgi:quercetin dioxygenase-like cupin family protein